MTLTQELDKIYYFMKRDIISFSTYKTNILLSVVSALFGALSYAFWGANASMPSVANLGMPVVTYLVDWACLQHLPLTEPHARSANN